MSPRRRFLVYLVVVHLLMAGVAALLLGDHRPWLLAAELVFVLSFVAGLALVRQLLAPLAFLRDSEQFLEDSDFMSRFREAGQPELDTLIRVYNRMVDSLRQERVRLQEQHVFLARLVHESPAAIVVLDFDGRVDQANPAAERLLQVPAGVLAGRPLAEAPGALAQAMAELAVGARQVVALRGGRRVRCQHGTFVDRGFRRSFFVAEELTEELRQSEKAAYEKVIRLLSHEVNNTVGASNSLLHSCLAYAGQLSDEDRADFEHAIGVVIGRTEQLSAFMRSFAEVVRLPAPHLQPGRIADVVADVASLVSAQCAERNITWSATIDAAVPPVAFDRVQFTQALLNVVKNALEAAGPGGRVEARVGRRDGRVVVEIEDSGPGIPDAARAHLFTPFYSTKEGGQGIGLTMVQEILQSHGCDYALDGPPTTFTIEFPQGN